MADTKSGQLFTRLEYELPETVRQVVCILNDARHHGTDLVLRMRLHELEETARTLANEARATLVLLDEAQQEDTDSTA
jgi:hypothetical protein